MRGHSCASSASPIAGDATRIEVGSDQGDLRARRLKGAAVGSAIGDILPLAIGVAVSPVPIIAVILMLFSQRAGINGPMFLLGWVVGLAGLGAITPALSNSSGASDNSNPATGISILKLVPGAALVLLAVRQWRSRNPAEEHAAPPKWMATIDDFTPVKAFGVGVLLSAVNPKNLLLTVGAATTIAGAGLGGWRGRQSGRVRACRKHHDRWSRSARAVRRQRRARHAR
jgi:threonine/homoserine/homoserine lactone efflux protein